MRRSAPSVGLLVTALAAAHCGPAPQPDASVEDVSRPDNVTPPDNAPPPADVPQTDATEMDTPTPPMDVPVPSDASTDTSMPPTDGPAPSCGTMRPDISGIRGTEGLIIGRDGTIYYSQRAAVGRLRPGMAPENSWVALPAAAGTVWGMVLNAANNRLYVGSPSAGTIYAIDPTAATPTATPLLTGAGGPNGLTMGPDGALYYSDFSGSHVYRVDVGTMMRTRVTTTTIPSANGVAFAADGSLYVASYSTGNLVRLTLTGGMESGRSTVAMGLGSPDGVAFDATGRIYIGDNSGRLRRLNADGTGNMVLRMSIPSAASVEFGAGPLNCRDIYVASSGTLVRFEGGDQPGAAVPWH